MAFYTKKQFAEICGVSRQYINEYIKRKQIVLSVVLSGYYIDNTIEPNISFLQKCLYRKKAESNIPLPPLELAENLFWELAEAKDKSSDYNYAAEKLTKGIIKDAEKNNFQFPLISISDTRPFIAQGFFDAYNFFLRREIEVLREAGVEPTPERIAQLINYYTALCKQSVELCLKDFKDIVTEIVAEYEEKEKNPAP